MQDAFITYSNGVRCIQYINVPLAPVADKFFLLYSASQIII